MFGISLMHSFKVYWGDLTIRILICLFALLSIACVYFYLSAYSSVKTQYKELTLQVSYAKNKHFYNKELLSNSRKIARYASVIEDFNSKLAKPYSGSDVVSEVAELFKSNKLHVLNESYSKIQYKDGIYLVKADFKLKGVYGDIKAMLHDMSAISYITIIERVGLSKESNGIISVDLHIKITGHISKGLDK